MTEKIYNCIWGILMVAVLGALAILLMAYPDMKYSEQEKRNLSQAPVLRVDTLADGSYMSGMEDYLADQFPYRNQFVEWKATMDRALGKLQSNEVFYCADGYLMENFLEKSPENTEQTIQAINELAKAADDARVTMLLIPNAISIYPEKLPEDISVADQNAYMDRFSRGLSEKVNFVDVRELFAESKEQVKLYYRTDHHWTTDAAYLAFQEVAPVMNLTMGEFMAGTICDSFYGSLSAKSGYRPKNADSIKAYLKKEPQLYTFMHGSEVGASLYLTEKLEQGDAYEVFLGGNYPEATIRTTVDTTRKLLVIKDSYANCFLPFLLDTYKEIKVIDPRYYAQDLETLLGSGIYEEVLLLYNVNTLSADNSLKSLVFH